MSSSYKVVPPKKDYNPNTAMMVRKDVNKGHTAENCIVVPTVFGDLMGDDMGYVELLGFANRVAYDRTTESDEGRVSNYCRKTGANRRFVLNLLATVPLVKAIVESPLPESYTYDEDSDDGFHDTYLKEFTSSSTIDFRRGWFKACLKATLQLDVLML